MYAQIKRFIREESAPTSVEYAIMLALVGLAIALAAPNIRDAVIGIFNDTAAALGGL